MQRFTIPRDLYFGDNAIEYLATVKGTKAFIVYGSNRLKSDGVIGKMQDYLKQAGIESTTFSGVEHDPSVTTVREGVRQMNEFQPDLIIAIGGGSPMQPRPCGSSMSIPISPLKKLQSPSTCLKCVTRHISLPFPPLAAPLLK